MVCRKYNIKFKPYTKNNYSLGSFIVYENNDCVIWCSLFNENFYECFFHEIGHIIDFRKTQYRTGRYSRYEGAYISNGSINYPVQGDYRKSLKESDNLFSKRIVSELVASRISIRMLKKLGKFTNTSEEYLIQAASTYIRCIDQRYIADVFCKASDYLKGIVNIRF